MIGNPREKTVKDGPADLTAEFWRMRITNGRTQVELDESTGCIVALRDLRNGLVHLDVRQHQRAWRRLFRLIVPTEEWVSRPVFAFQQSPPRITTRNGIVTLACDGLRTRDGVELPVNLTVEVSCPTGTDEVRFQMSVQNGGRGPITEAQFVDLGGWTGQGGVGRDKLMIGPVSEVCPFSLPANMGRTFLRIHQKRHVPYPVFMYAPWADLSGPQGGISYVNYMEQPRLGHFATENLAGHGPGLVLAMAWVHHLYVLPGESWTSPPIGLSVHGGDWRETADRYRAWTESRIQPVAVNRELRQTIGIQNVMFRNFDGTPHRLLEAIPEVAAIGRRYGVSHLCLWDRPMLGTYGGPFTNDLLEYPPAERAVLTNGVNQARRDGSRVSALVNFRLINPHLPVFEREEYHQEIHRTLDGSPRVENWSGSAFHSSTMTAHVGPNAHVFSPFSPKYRERVLQQIAEYCQLGFSDLFFDQPFEVLPDYSRQNDPQCKPESTYAAVLDLIRSVRERLQQENPDAYLIGEQCDVFGSQQIAWWMSWYTDLQMPVRAHYAIPHTMHSWVIDRSLGEASRAFAAGLYLFLCIHGTEGTLADEPALAEHVARLARLRANCAPRTVLGRFTHTRGLVLPENADFEAYGYDSPGGPAVVLTAEHETEATVELNQAAFSWTGNADRGTLHRLDGSSETVAGDVLKTRLSPNEVAIWEA